MSSTIEYEDGSKDILKGEHHRTVFLKPWQELVGVFELMSIEEGSFVLQLRTKAGPIRLVFAGNIPGGERLRELLADCSPGSRIGLLRTDLDTAFILLRRIQG